jgi:uncharacterized protein YdhG (YjbR/CyaY superfamily)
MATKQSAPKTIDAYIAGYPADVQALLQKVRRTIKQAAPEAEETIKYLIPTFTFNGNLISFAAYKNHIGLYPLPAGTEKFHKELAPYKAAKSTARFPLDQPIPYGLISHLVKFRVKESLAKVKAKEQKHA